MTDGELLRHYAKDGSEAAFEEFVGRYLSLVEGIARRKTGRESLVNEVSMQVFASVATKAAQLMARDSLGAWLVVATRFAARDALRKEQTQERHRRSIMEASSQESPSTAPPEDSWNEFGPLLDDALATLPEGEREAVVLHFYRRLPYREVGVRTVAVRSTGEVTFCAHASRAVGSLVNHCSATVVRLTDLISAAGRSSPI